MKFTVARFSYFQPEIIKPDGRNTVIPRQGPFQQIIVTVFAVLKQYIHGGPCYSHATVLYGAIGLQSWFSGKKYSKYYL